MKFLTAAVAASVLALASAASASTTFNFQFDNSGGGADGVVYSPVVGTGALTTSADLTAGNYTLGDLPDLALNFTMGSGANAFSFTNADLKTDISVITLVVVNQGGGLRAWTDGVDGPFNGSLDFINGDGYDLSLSPTYAGNHLYFADGPAGYASAGGSFGNYCASTTACPVVGVPEPSAWLFMLTGFGALGGVIRRRGLRLA